MQHRISHFSASQLCFNGHPKLRKMLKLLLIASVAFVAAASDGKLFHVGPNSTTIFLWAKTLEKNDLENRIIGLRSHDRLVRLVRLVADRLCSGNEQVSGDGHADPAL